MTEDDACVSNSCLIPDWLRAVRRSWISSTSDPIREENRNLVIESNDGGIHTSIADRGPVWLGWAHSIQTLRKSELDEKYPHVCFKCKNPLKFKELLTANTETDKDYLEKLWKTEAVEFYCCDCYRKEKYHIEWNDRLDAWCISLDELQEHLSRRIEQDREMTTGVHGREISEIWVDEIENLEFGYDIAEE